MRGILLLVVGLAAAGFQFSEQSRTEPVARARVWATLEERDLVLEGTAWDPSTQSVLVGSLHKSKVVAIALDGSVRDRVAPRSHGVASIAGIHVDSLRRTLWVTSNARYDQPADTTTSALFAFDARTGAFRARYDLLTAARHFLNDVTTAPDGTVYVTDSRAGRVWRLRPNAAQLEEFTAAGVLGRPNGITISSDGRHLFVSDSGRVRVVPVAGGAPWTIAVPDSIEVPNIDGLAFARGSLIAHHPGAQGRIVKYEMAAGFRAITRRTQLEAYTSDVRTSTTGEVVNDEYVFIGNGQINRMNEGTVDFATMDPIRMYRVQLSPQQTEYVLVSLSARDSIAVLDAHTLARVATLAVGRNPHEIAAARDGRRAYVANAGGTTISALALDSAPRVEANWQLPDSISVHDVAVAGDGRSVWAASGRQQLVLRIDAATGRVVRRFPLERAGPWLLEMGGPGGAVVVSHLEGGAVTLLDASSGAQRVLPLSAGQVDAAPARDSATVWTVNFTDSTVTVLDARSGRVLNRQISGVSAGRVVMSPDGRTAFTVNSGDSTIVAWNVRTRARVGSISVSAGPKVIALSADGRRAYVSHPEGNALTMIDLASMTVLRRMELPGTPDGVVVSGSSPTRPR